MKKVLAILTVLAAVAFYSLAADKPSRPNIIFILADDTGIDNYGCYGSDRFKDRTPNIDALAKTGIRFERCYSEPLCGPSRCQIMTGRYAFRTGGLNNAVAHEASFKNEPSLARSLKQAGYATGMAGKWRQVSDSPGDWGFDEFLTDDTAGGWYWEKRYNKNGQRIEKDQEVYGPDECFDFAADFFRRHKDKPFFFYFPTHLVHLPMRRTPDTKPDTRTETALYDDNMVYMDKQVGLLVAELEKLGLREKTLIIFSGDNGTAKQSNTIGGREINGHKGTMKEGGARVPLIANWPGTTPTGKVLSDLFDFSDFFPTFVEVAGAKMPKGVTFDGHSFAPQLHGKKGQPREWIYVQLSAKWYVRNDGWKLTQSGELLDMTDSPFVEKLVPDDTPDAAAKAARKKLQAVLDELNPTARKTAPAKEGAGKKAKRQAGRPAKQQE